MTSSDSTCFVCRRYAEVDSVIRDSAFAWVVKCHWCGWYSIRKSIPEDWEGDAEAQKLLPFLAAYIRQSSQSRPVSIDSDWMVHASAHASNTIPQKVRALLEWVAGRTTLGEKTSIQPEELAPCVNARNEAEARYLLNHLETLRYVKVDRSTIPSKDRLPSGGGDLFTIEMQVAGWEAISPVAGSGLAGTCFVAMWFDPSLNDAYDQGIIPAVRDDCGFRDIRIDRLQFNGWITDRILSDIRASQFVVADYTGQRPNVYFEAGFALALGRVLIETCQAQFANTLHFDVRQRNVIRWESPAGLRAQLADRIRATVTLPARMAPGRAS